jgi:hypothetical protein
MALLLVLIEKDMADFPALSPRSSGPMHAGASG